MANGAANVRWLVGVMVALLALAGCGSRRPSAAVQGRLVSAVAARDASFDFAAADPGFVWDRMLVFGPYRQQSEVDKALGFPWADYRETLINRSKSACLVVFVQGGRVVDWFEQSRRIDLGPLEQFGGNVGYARGEAKFRVEGSGEQAALRLERSSSAPATAR